MTYDPSAVDAKYRRYTKLANGCWRWDGHKDQKGYGGVSVKINGRFRNLRAHRYLYELMVGPVAKELHLDHLCRNPSCVNPAHLEPVTPRENTMRGVGPTKVNAEKTHCLRGHPLSGDNVYRKPGTPNWRQCRKCQTMRQYMSETRWGRQEKIKREIEAERQRDVVAGFIGSALDALRELKPRLFESLVAKAKADLAARADGVEIGSSTSDTKPD